MNLRGRANRMLGGLFACSLIVFGGCNDETPAVLATAIIGPAGGTLEIPAAQLVLTVPPGAVASDTTFTVSESSKSGPEGQLGSAVRLQPEDVTFSEPIELTYTLNLADLPSGAFLDRVNIVTFENGEWQEAGTEVVTYDAATGSFSVNAYTEHFSDWVIRDSGLAGTLYGAGGSDLSNLTAAGQGGLVRYMAGSTTVESASGETWFDYFSDGVTEYIVGVDNSRTPQLRTRPVAGGTWSAASLPGTNSVLRGMHGAGSSIIAVGFLGRIVSWDGSSWQDESVSTAGHFYDVHVFGSGEAIAVGTGATVMIRTGGTWAADAIPSNLATRLSLRGVWGTSTTDFYAVGFRGRDGVILHRTASGWSEERVETQRPVHGVAGSPTNTHFVGAGVFVRRDASGSYSNDNLVDLNCSPASQSVTLYDIFVDASDNFVAVGSNGAIVNNLPCGTDAGTPTTMDAGTDAGTSLSVSSVGVGWNFTCAFLSRGAVRCWGGVGGEGAASEGYLGYSSTVMMDVGDNETPASVGDVPLGGTSSSLSTGRTSSCVVMDSNDALRCWGAANNVGYTEYDEIGDDETPADTGDVNLGGAAVAQVAVGAHHTCALLMDGNVRCWGVNNSGELGYANTTWIGDASGAGNVDIGGAVMRLEAGDWHTCALLSGGSIRCWGWGQGLAIHGYPPGHPGLVGFQVGDDETPAQVGDVPIGEAVIDVAAGGFHTCVLLQSGAVRCWGQGTAGQLGYANADSLATIPTSDVVVTTDPARSVVDLVAGFEHTCALLDDGSVTCWGENEEGQLGYGHTNNIGDTETPASAGTIDVGGTVLQLATNRWHTCALLTSGGVRCWGLNDRGQLGYGHTNNIGDDEAPSTAGDVTVE